MRINLNLISVSIIILVLVHLMFATITSKILVIASLLTALAVLIIDLLVKNKKMQHIYLSFTDNIKIPIILKDKSDKILYTNIEAKNIFGDTIPNVNKDTTHIKLVTSRGRKRFNVLLSHCNDIALYQFLDVTELSELKKQLYTSQNQAAIGILTSGLSHDFKNMLQNINIYISLIKRSKDSEEVALHCNTIKQMIDDSNEFIKNILTLSKNQKKEFEKINLDQVIKETVSLIEKILPENISISYLNFASGCEIKTVATMLKQILINLAQNSAEALKNTEKAFISIVVEKTSIKLMDFIKIDFKDNGKGISGEKIDKIFDPFFTTNEKSGTGLGLTMVKILVKELGGFIDVNSKYGEGTCFSIYLPTH
ncbi:MAG: histidine kinase [Deferribacteraceae bacterium]|nr:histidine kinase [Deferribacteraceae bacterium]